MSAALSLLPLAIWFLGHAYLGWRMIRPSPLRGSRSAAAWGVLTVMAILPVVNFVVSQAGVILPVAVSWIGFLSMGVSSCLLIFSVAAEGVRLPWSFVSRRVVSKQNPSRRRFFTNVVNASIASVTGSLTAIGVANARHTADVAEVEVPIDGLPPDLEGFTIVQLSDVHVGPTIQRVDLEAIVQRTNDLRADMIALTGDLVDGYVSDLRDEVAPFGDLRARFGVYFVTGNHEYYWDGPAWCRHFASLGLRVLNNDYAIVPVGSARLLVGGVTDYHAPKALPGHASDPHSARRDAPAHDVSVLLAHQPSSVFEASAAGFDLQLSGHTHGGQYFPLTPIVWFAQPYFAGLHRHENMWIYVSRGTGYWGPPMRVAAPHEITRIRLIRAA